ncbi:hypothetical protein JKP88DRAFT_240830 [Tribonema minus]|uniref:Uncharacterized protein n=1 Tax=Tribonema minus TaxID=303371 RepID=A0A835Z9W8_9STRA|nr:hypothetical protein JKP88DRAFT_240830 [Tribonema minus]
MAEYAMAKALGTFILKQATSYTLKVLQDRYFPGAAMASEEFVRQHCGASFDSYLVEDISAKAADVKKYLRWYFTRPTTSRIERVYGALEALYNQINEHMRPTNEREEALLPYIPAAAAQARAVEELLSDQYDWDSKDLDVADNFCKLYFKITKRHMQRKVNNIEYTERESVKRILDTPLTQGMVSSWSRVRSNDDYFKWLQVFEFTVVNHNNLAHCNEHRSVCDSTVPSASRGYATRVDSERRRMQQRREQVEYEECQFWCNHWSRMNTMMVLACFGVIDECDFVCFGCQMPRGDGGVECTLFNGDLDASTPALPVRHQMTPKLTGWAHATCIKACAILVGRLNYDKPYCANPSTSFNKCTGECSYNCGRGGFTSPCSYIGCTSLVHGSCAFSAGAAITVEEFGATYARVACADHIQFVKTLSTTYLLDKLNLVKPDGMVGRQGLPYQMPLRTLTDSISACTWSM